MICGVKEHQTVITKWCNYKFGGAFRQIQHVFLLLSSASARGLFKTKVYLQLWEFHNTTECILYLCFHRMPHSFLTFSDFFSSIYTTWEFCKYFLLLPSLPVAKTWHLNVEQKSKKIVYFLEDLEHVEK